MSYYMANGGFRPIPTNIFSSSVANGNYGVTTSPIGGFCCNNSTPQISGTQVTKINNELLRVTDSNGNFHFVNNLGQHFGGGSK